MLPLTVTLSQSNATTMAKHTQDRRGSQPAAADIKGAPGLDDLIPQGARRIIEQAIEAELAAMREQYSNVKTMDGRRA
ncbi:MAG: IS256 family transposase, partial [Burkholderia sp.]